MIKEKPRKTEKGIHINYKWKISRLMTNAVDALKFTHYTHIHKRWREMAKKKK